MRWPICLRLSLALSLALAPGILSAQLAGPPSLLPPPLYVRLVGPPGMQVTVYRGGQGQTLAAPCILGLRPGYHYRLQLGNIAGRRGLTLFPSLDVLGSLRLPGPNAIEHPATLVFGDDDFVGVAAGAVITKVVVLERPATAIPLATLADQPIEQMLAPRSDLLAQAAERGRPVMVMNLGGRDYTPEELAQQAVPGTMLLPGEKVLPAPRDPPCLPWMCFPLVDPRAGLDSPADEMCFHDGGDSGPPVGYGPDGKLRGLDASDTVAQYQDSKGNPKIAISNRVCLCVPRFVVLRTQIATAFNVANTKPGNTRIVQAPSGMKMPIEAIVQAQAMGVAGVNSQQRLSFLSQETHTFITARIEGLHFFSSQTKTGNVTGSCPPPEQPEPVEKPLVIIKWPDKCDPKIGDAVTFYIKYSNRGQLPIGGIVVNDSLTARLEYVPGSAETDRDALFTTTPNEVDSLLLRWEVSGELGPGQSGIVSFQARVR